EFGVMIINGDLNLANKAGMVLNGNLYVNGDIKATNMLQISGTGSLEATGEVNIKKNGNAVVFGNSAPCTPGPCQYGSGSGLPIQLVSFDGRHIDGGRVKLEWLTESEINNEFFVIEKSFDGFIFEEVAKVKGAGNSIS